MDRCVYIPFKREQAPDFIRQSHTATMMGTFGLTHHERKFAVVCYDDPGEPLKELGASIGTRILIAGHGLAGRPYISNSSGHGQKEYLLFNFVVDRMIESGLQKRYVGTVSCDVYYSSVDNDRNPAFADLVARYLHAKGYRFAHTMGYMGALFPVPEEMTNGHKFYHRVVELMGDDGTKTTLKSKDANTRLWGTEKVPAHLENLSSALNTCPAY